LAAASSGPARWVHQRFAALNRDLEQCLLPQFDGCLVCSESDAARISVARPVIVPNTIAWHPRVERQKDPALVFSGNLEYHPNIQGVRWFYECIWPGLRRANADLKWRLVGMNPHAVERIVASDPRIECTGPVEDALDWIGRSRLAVVPLRSGSGTRVKILEAWAAGTAVVSTAIGAEGLPAEGALRIADRADDFVRVVNELLSNAEERLRLESAGRATYEEYFHYQAAWKRLDQAQIL
jgi:glycosyltransferase involved in cell wall biosynthesis